MKVNNRLSLRISHALLAMQLLTTCSERCRNPAHRGTKIPSESDEGKCSKLALQIPWQLTGHTKGRAASYVQSGSRPRRLNDAFNSVHSASRPFSSQCSEAGVF